MHPKIAQVRNIQGWDICGSSGVYDTHDAARDIFGEYEYDMRGNQVMYLFRRFGYPIHGWDDHKSVMDFFLTTPDADVILWCKPYSQPWLSFGFGLSPAFAAPALDAMFAWRRAESRTAEWEDTPTHRRIDKAIRNTMRELLRPVYIRDVDYNLFGRPEAKYGKLKAAEPSPQAGYGVGDFDPAA